MDDCDVEETEWNEPDIPGMDRKDGQNVIGRGIHIQKAVDVVLQEEIHLVPTMVVDIHKYEGWHIPCLMEDTEGIEDTDIVQKLEVDIEQSWEEGMVDLKMVAQGDTHISHRDMEIESCNYPSM